jgi:hypothetical protein
MTASRQFRVVYRHRGQREPAAGASLVIPAASEREARRLARLQFRAMFFNSDMPRIAWVDDVTDNQSPIFVDTDREPC